MEHRQINLILQRLTHPQIAVDDINRYKIPGRLIYVIDHSYPYSNDGYAVRTHGIASTLVRQGYSVVAINRPGNPWCMPGFNEKFLESYKEIDGVRYLYLRAPHKNSHDYIEASAEALKELLRIFKPGILMASSNWENALPAAIAAKELGLPFFYEVRGFWEMSRISREGKWENSSQHKHAIQMERALGQAANQIFTLNQLMRDELTRFGINEDKISIMPNGYPDVLPDLSYKSKLQKSDLGCNTKYVIGYIGTFSEYEGLDDLVKACSQVRQQGLDVSLLLVGSSNPSGLTQGSLRNCSLSLRLKKLADSLGFSEYLHLTGRVPYKNLIDYYALVDLVVIPRKSYSVSELVPPIKPAEAAAHGKAILVSDVNPLRDIMQEAQVNECFKAGDITALALKIKEILGDKNRLKALGRAYRQWVSTQRTWTKVTESFVDKYPAGSIVAGSKQSRPTYADKHRYKKIIEFLPFENSKPKSSSKLRVASILDAFSHACFDPICDLISLTPQKWKEQLASHKIDMILVESAWHGNNDAWLYRIAKYNAPPGNELSDVINWAKKANIPTVFWNKEDPPNFDRFIDSATKFDYVFTTDANCIDHYRKYVSENTYIAALPFAAQPLIHNPHMKKPRLPLASFAGTYYADDFSSRRQAMDMLLRIAGRYGLDIYDRMYDVTGKEKERYKFPEDLQNYIRGKLNYEEMLKAYRRYRVGLNVNSVSNSPTMFSRRVFELLACGTPVVSTHSLGIERIFKGLVATVESEGETIDALESLMTDPLKWLKSSIHGIRNVFESHTYTHRLLQIAKALGLQMNGLPYKEIVLVLFPDGDLEAFSKVIANQKKHPVEIVIVGLKYNDDNVKKYLNHLSFLNIKTTAIPRGNVPDYLRTRYPLSTIAICNSKHHYGPSYLLDANITVCGDPSVHASTMHPTEDAQRWINKMQFKDIDSLGMDTTLAFIDTLVFKSESKILDYIFREKMDGYMDLSEPIMNRPWVDFTLKTNITKYLDILDI